MTIKIQYDGTQDEKDRIVSEQETAGNFLVGEHNLYDGNFLLFEDDATYQGQIKLIEIENIKDQLKTALVWQFRMILALWEVGVSKGIWSPSDIADTTLKQKVVDWKAKLERLEALGE